MYDLGAGVDELAAEGDAVKKWTVCCLTLVIVAVAANVAWATTGGPYLSESMGWNPKTGEVFFRIHVMGESGYAPVIVRLSSRKLPLEFEAMPWSREAYAGSEDSAYAVQVRKIERNLLPLEPESGCSTIPSWTQVMEADSVSNKYFEARRYRVRAYFGCAFGTVQAFVFREPSIRLLRTYRLPGTSVAVGLFSFIGIPHEGGYEVQVPFAFEAKDRRPELQISVYWDPSLAWWSSAEAVVPRKPIK